MIRSKRITSDATTREQSSKSCLDGLSDTWWSEVRDHGVGNGEVLVMPGQWTIWSTPPSRMTKKKTNTASVQEIHGTSALVHFPDNCPIPWKDSLRPTQEQGSRQRLADALGSTTSRCHETRRNAAGGASVASFCRRREHARAARLLSLPTASTAPLVSFATSSTIYSWSIDFAPGDRTVAACISPPKSPSLAHIGHYLLKRLAVDSVCVLAKTSTTFVLVRQFVELGF